MSLFAFDDFSASPVSEIASASSKQRLASELNAAILSSQGLKSHSRLQLYMKMLFWS